LTPTDLMTAADSSSLPRLASLNTDAAPSTWERTCPRMQFVRRSKCVGCTGSFADRSAPTSSAAITDLWEGACSRFDTGDSKILAAVPALSRASSLPRLVGLNSNATPTGWVSVRADMLTVAVCRSALARDDLSLIAPPACQPWLAVRTDVDATPRGHSRRCTPAPHGRRVRPWSGRFPGPASGPNAAPPFAAA